MKNFFVGILAITAIVFAGFALSARADDTGSETVPTPTPVLDAGVIHR